MSLSLSLPFFNQPSVTTTPQAPPVDPTQPGNPPAMPGTNLDNVTVPADTLQIGNQYFGNVRKLAAGLTPEEAAQLTRGNGFDEIYFTDEAGDHYVAFQEKSHFQDMRVGYLGRFNGKRVRVMAMEDETNTFKEGVGSVFGWTKGVLSNTFGNEASKSLSGVVSTAVGSFVAAAALKNGAQQAAPLIREGFLTSIKGAMRGALSGAVNTLSTVVLFFGAAIGIASLIGGLRAINRRGRMTTIDMVTGNYQAPMLLFLRVVTALALAAWFGGMLFFAMGVAPVAFGVLPDRVLAGNVVNGAMRQLHLLAYVAAAVALVAYAARAWIEPGAIRLLTGFKVALVALMLGLTLFSGLWLSPTLAQMRQEVGAIDALPAGDPIKERFGGLHRLSVTVMGVTMLGVLAVIVLEQVGGDSGPKSQVPGP